MLLRTLKLQKEICSASFTIATSVQENCENILKDTLALSPMLPKQSKELFLYYSEQCWLNLNRMKASSLASIDLFEKLTLPPVVSPARTSRAAPGTQATAHQEAPPRKKTAAKKSTPAKKQIKTNPAVTTVAAGKQEINKAQPPAEKTTAAAANTKTPAPPNKPAVTKKP